MGDATGHLLILGKSFEDRLERARRSLFLLVLCFCLFSPVSAAPPLNCSLHFKVRAVPIWARSDPLDFFLSVCPRLFSLLPSLLFFGSLLSLPFLGRIGYVPQCHPPTSIPLQAYFILFLIHEHLGQVPCMEQGPNAMPGPHLHSEPRAPQVKQWKPKGIIQCWVALRKELLLSKPCRSHRGAF